MFTNELLHIRLKTILQSLPKGQLFILTDTNSNIYCMPILAKVLGDREYNILTIEAGEQNKDLDHVKDIWNFLIKYHATREALLINLGGGMITDLGGFAAATYMRGIRFVNIPTTLLAMVDASTGGKTGFDYQGIKNSIGCFTNAEVNIIYPYFIKTLPEKEILSGFAEILKHSLIASKKEWVRLLNIYDEDGGKEFLMDCLINEDILASSVTIKQEVVKDDPDEKGWRKILNFGHTIGHAIESSALDNNNIQPHGYCVMWGMVAEVYLSVVHAGCPREILHYITKIMLDWYGRPECGCKERKQLIERMYHDKKNNANHTPNFTLLHDVGQPIINQYLSEEDINEALEYLFSL